MITSRIQATGLIAIILLNTPIVSAKGLCKRCNGTGRCEKSITVTEMKTVTKTCYREEQQLKVVRVPKVIQVPKEVPYEYTAWVRVKKEDVQEIEVKTPKFRWVDQKYTVDVPGKDVVTRFRTRTEHVAVTKPCTTTEDHGHWETKMVPSKTCGGCPCTEKKVWCPNPVQVTTEKTVMECVEVKEPYVCEVDIVVPIPKERRVKEYFTKTETKKVKHPYTTLEPRTRTKTVTAYVPETVYEEKTEVCKVKVPYTVEKLIPVQVTRKVPCDCSCQHGH